MSELEHILARLEAARPPLDAEPGVLEGWLAERQEVVDRLSSLSLDKIDPAMRSRVRATLERTLQEDAARLADARTRLRSTSQALADLTRARDTVRGYRGHIESSPSEVRRRA